MHAWTDGQTDGRTDGWMDGRMDGWTDGRMDGWTDGWTDGTENIYSIFRDELLLLREHVFDGPPSMKVEVLSSFLLSAHVSKIFTFRIIAPPTYIGI